MLHRLSLSFFSLPFSLLWEYLLDFCSSHRSQRRQLRALQHLDDRLLADIGLTRHDARLAALSPPEPDDLMQKYPGKHRLIDYRRSNSH